MVFSASTPPSANKKKKTLSGAHRRTHFGVQINAAIRVHVLCLRPDLRTKNINIERYQSQKGKKKICKWDEIKKRHKRIRVSRV